MSEVELTDLVSVDEDPEEHFSLMERLGKGTYGEVFKAHHKASGRIVAAKIIPVRS